MGQKLHLRTWSSGCPHWLGTNYVHAPGYGQFGLSHPELWGRVIKETPADVIMQTKVYHSDCEPNSRFTTLLGNCKPHVEMVEYQQVGQFIGRQYFPASTVNYTAATMKKALELVGPDGGVQMHAGGESQPASFDVFARHCEQQLRVRVARADLEHQREPGQHVARVGVGDLWRGGGAGHCHLYARQMKTRRRGAGARWGTGRLRTATTQERLRGARCCCATPTATTCRSTRPRWSRRSKM